MIEQWWESLGERERLYLGGGAVALVLLLFYSIVISPLYGSVAKMEKALPRKQQDLQWMEQAVTQIKQMERSRPRTSSRGRSLAAIIDQQMKLSGLKTSRMEPNGKNNLKVWLKGSSFDQIITLLGKLEQNDGITVTSLSISPLDKPGLIDARITLDRGSS